jgi:hypothetical protein
MVAVSNGNLYVGLSAAANAPSSQGVYESTDHGSTWISANTGLHSDFGVPPRGLAVSSSNPAILYVTDYFGLYETTNGGGNWAFAGGLPGGTIAIAVSTNDPSTLLYSAYDATAPLFTSTNSGKNWTPSSGLGVAAVTELVPDRFTGGAYGLANVNYSALIAKIDPTGQHLLYSTYFGEWTGAYAIAIGEAGSVTFTGYLTDGIPVTPTALQPNRPGFDAFVARISEMPSVCSVSIDPPQTLEVWFTHYVEFFVTAPSGCAWTATSNQAWATIVSGAMGTGSGVVYVLASNTGATQTATITIGGTTATLRQRTSTCGYEHFDRDAVVVPGSGGTITLQMIVGAGCEWSVPNYHPAAMSITSGASGVGSGTVMITVFPNHGPNTRTLTIDSRQGAAVTISQAGTTAPAVVANVTSSPSGASFTVSGAGCIPGSYLTPAKLTWDANTNCTTVFDDPQVLSGNTADFNNVSINGGAPVNENPVTVNSGTRDVTIDASFLAPCTYSLTPTGQSFAAAGGLGSFTVTTASNCVWKPVANVSWVTILPSGSQGTGRANFSVASNTDGARTGTIFAGGQPFTVSQGAFTCTYAIGPTSASVASAGGDVSVSVSAPAGCAWGSVSNASWLHITSASAGSGTGSITIHADANSGSERTGTVTVAGGTFTAIQQGATNGTACGAVDVSGSVTTSRSGLTWVPFSTYIFTQSLTVKNGSGAVIPGPVFVVLRNLPSGVLLQGALRTACFSSAGDYMVLVSAGDLAPGQSGGYGLAFIAPTFNPFISYSTTVLSGLPSR